jgi:hypothetical protein
MPLSVESMFKNNFKEFVREHYHLDFAIDDDVDGYWLVEGKNFIWFIYMEGEGILSYNATIHFFCLSILFDENFVI